MKMRCYQERLINAAFREFSTVQRTLIVAATGTGKTVCFATIAKKFLDDGRRVMVLAHRDELIQQACAKLRDITGVLPTVEKADQWSDEENMHGKPPLVVSRFRPSEFGLVIADEAHHSTSDSWSKVLEHYASNPECKILGVTATPDRADGQLLGTMFQTIAGSYTLHDAVADGYLVPVRPWMIEIEGLDFSRVKTTAGDLNQNDLEEAMLFEEPLHGIAFATIESAYDLEPGTLRAMLDDERRVSKLKELIGDRVGKKCLVFCVSVAHAERLADIFDRWLPKSSDVVSGKLADDDRQKRLKAFKDGRVRFLCNCMIATEGFDEPSIETVVMARPTKSRSLYVQMLGRGTRPAEDIASLLGDLPTPEQRVEMIRTSSKPYMAVLDFVGNSGRHELVTTIDIFGTVGEYSDKEIERAKELTEDGDVTAEDALERSREELEQKRRESEVRRKEMEEKRKRQLQQAGRENLVGAGSYKKQELDEWANPPEQATPGQVKILRSAKVPAADIQGWSTEKIGELCRKIVIHRQFGLCTYRQAKVLAKRGWPREALEKMTFTDASSTIDEIAKSGWKLRYES